MRKFTFILMTILVGLSNAAKAQLSFTANGQTITSNNSWDIRLIDLNGDTIPDAVFESKVWLNDGKGNFTKSSLYIGSGLYPSFADLNDDGFIDILNQDSIFINDGSFNFTYSKTLVSDIAMISSFMADIDNDDDMDIISCSDVTDRLLLNEGSGNFTNTTKSLGGWGQAKYAVGDMNGDGYSDIYVAIPHIPPMGGHTPNLIWLGDSLGNFTQKTHDISGAESRGVVLADFDGDSDLDLFVSDAASWGRVFTNDGNGNFTNSGQKLGSRTGSVKSADFNNDGNLDLFICQGDGNGVTGNGAPGIVWLGDGKGQFTDSKVRLQIGNTNSIAVDAADIDNDGKSDAVVSNVKLDAENAYTPMFCPVEVWLNNTFLCDYFGQTPPGDTAVIFAPGIISLTARSEAQIAFSPDGEEIYLVAGNGIYMQYKDNKWGPQIAPPVLGDAPFYSLDGKRIFFTVYNWNNTHTAVTSSDIYEVDRNDGDWGQPRLLQAPINSSSFDGSFSQTADSIIYFHSNRSGSYEIWRINPLTNQAETLGSAVNSGDASSPCVAPDGSYIVFESSREGSLGNDDLYVTFKKSGNDWTAPLNLNSSGSEINLVNHSQIYSSLSPDGKYLFFNRHNWEDLLPDIYWVSTHILDTLKKIAFNTTEIKETENENLISIYPNPVESVFTIAFQSNIAGNATAEIYTVDGKLVLQQKLYNTTSTIDLTGYPAGLYFLKVSTSLTSISKKFFKV